MYLYQRLEHDNQNDIKRYSKKSFSVAVTKDLVWKPLLLGKLHKFVFFAMENVCVIEDNYRHCYFAKSIKIRQVYNGMYNVSSCHIYLGRH